MADDPKTTTQTEQNPDTPTIVSPFAGNAWSETVPEPLKTAEASTDPPAAAPTPAASVSPTITPTATGEEEILDTKEWLKREFNWESEEAAKTEITELRKLKDTPQTPPEIKFENEQSKHIHELIRQGKTKEVRQYLDTQEKLDNYTSIEVNKDTAEDIIKLSISLKNKDLTSQEIDFEYRQNYVASKEPVQKSSESDEEFLERQEEWKEKNSMIEMKKIIAAKMAKPELEAAKTKLVLPELQNTIDPKIQEANQKELERQQELRNLYLKSLESDYSKFNGYEVKYKDEAVEIPVNFMPTDEEKIALKKEMETFDVDGFIIGRWFDEKGTPNIKQAMEDITLLRKKEAIFQKIANEVGAKMKEHYIKLKHNTDVNGSPQQTFQPNQNGQAAISPFAQEAWSDKPPVFN